MEKVFEQLGLEIQNKESNKASKFYFIRNQDESIRWMWAADASTPEFLKFYHQSGIKSIVFAFFMQVVFALKLQHWYFRKSSFKAIVNNDSPLKKYENSEFFVFTGTAGPNRKYTFFVKGLQRNAFVKWAFSEKASTLIKSEAKNIERMRSLKLKSFALPRDITVNEHTHLTISEKFETVIRTDLRKVHVRALSSIKNSTKHKVAYSDFLELHKIPQRISELRNNTGAYLPKGITRKLDLLLKKLESTQEIELSLAHGDFTPWNCKFKKGNKLYIFDWEFMNEDYPILFDAIHYITQNAILVDRKNWKNIKETIYNRFQRFLPHYIKNLELYIDLYLLVNTLNQLEIFYNQTKWHTQVAWLLNTWNQALSESLMHHAPQREILIGDIYDALHHHDYATLKKEHGNPIELDEYSDLDICIRDYDAKNIIDFLKNHPLVNEFKNKSLSYTNAIKLVTHTGELLSLDLVHQFKRKSMYYLRIENLINTANTSYYGNKVANPIYTARYIALFYGLNGAGVPKKYENHLRTLKDSHIESDQFLYKCHTKKNNNLDMTKYYKQYAENQGINRFINFTKYVADTLKSIAITKGMMISFSGVDGAGKSTLIEHTKFELEKKYRRKVVVLRHRPSIFPILSAFKYGKKEAEQRSVQSLPRTGNNSSTLNSLARFAYYYTDYILGQFVVYIKHVLKGDIVLYDRFYFDFIHDSLRSNMRLPKWIVKTGFNFILKPRTNFFLYADADTILERKQELDAETIQSLTESYSQHFTELKQKHQTQYHLVNTKNWKESQYSIISKLAPEVI